jgi:branched-chain amino acid transport system ATP-binding protein
MPLLKVDNLQVSYGAVKALHGVSFEVETGEVLTLIGANGAGKTTTLKAICGLLHHDGVVKLRGENVGNLSAYQLVERGLALVPEGRGIFGRLTVRENLRMGAYIRDDKAEIRADLERVYALFPRLGERRNQTGGTLSGGEQQMLAIGRALMSRPKLLLLDEPSMGLAPMMVEKIFDTVRMVSKEGVTVLLVEQNAKLALEASHRGYVMESGLITLADGAPALLDNPLVRKAYLGE